MGSFYWIFGVFEFLLVVGVRVWGFHEMNVTGDLMGALVLFVIGSILIYGGARSLRGRPDSIGFTIVGGMLGYLLAGIYILVIFSTLSVMLLTGEGEVGWSVIIEGVVPQVYLVLPLLFLTIPIFRALGKKKQENGGEGKR